MMEAEIDVLFKNFDNNGSPGCSVAVWYRGETIYKKAFGMANIEYGVKNTPETVFHVASISKQFTAFCILLLAEEGKISLDAGIREYLPQLPSFKHDIILRHLLHHTSGLREQWDMFELSGNTAEDLVTGDCIMRLVCGQRELSFKPGDQYCYCNTGFTILGQLIKAVTGKTLRDFACERIFKPLGMSSTYFRDNHGEIAKNRAYSYGIEKPGGPYVNMALTFDIAGSTSLNTTASDLLKWTGNLRTPRICSQNVLGRMFEKFRLNSGETIDYCSGLKGYTYRGTAVYEHTGSNAGFRAVLIAMPEIQLDVVVLSNYMHSSPLAKGYQIVDLVAGGELQPKRKPAYYTPTALYETLREGWYASSSHAKAYLKKNNGDIVFEREEMDWLFRHRGGNEYYCDKLGGSLYPQKDGSVVYEMAVITTVYKNVRELEITDADREGVSGSYFSPELRALYELSFEGNELHICHMRTGVTRFIKTGENSYLAVNKDKLGLVLKKGNGRTSLLVSTDRTRDLEFIKIDWKLA